MNSDHGTITVLHATAQYTQECFEELSLNFSADEENQTESLIPTHLLRSEESNSLSTAFIFSLADLLGADVFSNVLPPNAPPPSRYIRRSSRMIRRNEQHDLIQERILEIDSEHTTDP